MLIDKSQGVEIVVKRVNSKIIALRLPGTVQMNSTREIFINRRNPYTIIPQFFVNSSPILRFSSVFGCVIIYRCDYRVAS